MRFEIGKIYTVIGKNGSGKTTLANSMMGLEGYKNLEGGIFLNENEITEKDLYERSKMGLTKFWQDPPNYKGVTVKEYLNLNGKLKLSEEEIDEIFKIIGISRKVYENRFMDSNLSGGERKRIELASVLALKKDYTIMDEPDSGIDLMSLEVVINALKNLRDNGKTSILITHREEIARIADYSYLICDGKIIRQGKGDEVIDYYKNSCDYCSHPNSPEQSNQPEYDSEVIL